MSSKKSSKLKETSKSSLSKDKDKEQEKVIDLVDEDRTISGQKYVCLSFISPENHIKKKGAVFFRKVFKEL